MSDKEYKLEDKLQQDCFMYVWNHYPEYRRTFFRVKNEGKKNIKTAMKDKAMGNVAGIPDMIFMEPAMGIELKVGYNKQTEAQLEVQQAWEQKDIEYFVLRSFEEFEELIRVKLGEPKIH